MLNSVKVALVSVLREFDLLIPELERALTASAFEDAFRRLPPTPASTPETGGLIAGGSALGSRVVRLALLVEGCQVAVRLRLIKPGLGGCQLLCGRALLQRIELCLGLIDGRLRRGDI